jgi:hypothetical protein
LGCNYLHCLILGFAFFGVWSLEFSVFVFSLVCKHAYPIKQEKTIEQMFE